MVVAADRVEIKTGGSHPAKLKTVKTVKTAENRDRFIFEEDYGGKASIMIARLEKIDAIITNKVDDAVFLSETP